MGSQIVPINLERRDHIPPTRAWKEGVTHTTPTHLERGDHTSHRHTWEEEITHHTYTPGETGSHTMPRTCKEAITYQPTHSERRDHTSYRHIWEEGITHHADTHLGRWDHNHIDTPGKRRSYTIPKILGRRDHRSYPQGHKTNLPRTKKDPNRCLITALSLSHIIFLP